LSTPERNASPENMQPFLFDLDETLIDSDDVTGEANFGDRPMPYWLYLPVVLEEAS